MIGRYNRRQPANAQEAREQTGQDIFILRHALRELGANRSPESERLAVLLETVIGRLENCRAYMMDPAACDALRLAAQEGAAQAEGWRTLLWQTMQDARALARACQDGQAPCRRALSDWLPLQLLLGELRAGGDGAAQAAAIRAKLARALRETPAPAPAPSAPLPDAADWTLSAAQGEAASLRADLHQALAPPLDWRALAGRLLPALDEGSEQALTSALADFGIQPLSYEQAPQALRCRFAVYDNGGSYPGLFRQDGGTWVCLAGGGHRADRPEGR